MPRRHRVRPFVRTAQVIALVAAFLPAVTSAQQPRPFDESVYDAPSTARGGWSDTIPGHLAIVDGDAWLERDGDVERAEENIALLAGDRIRTANGRAEVLFADGSVLDIDRATTVALLSESLLGLERGQVRLTLARAPASADYRIDGAGATAWIRAAGEYRVAVAGPSSDLELRLTVIRGSAELASPHGRTAVRTGYEAVTSAETIPSLPYTVSVAITDPFDRWAYERRAERIGVASAQYLPEPIDAYSGTLDRYGDWQYERPYGYVWYPRVATAWRPYHDGRWSFAASFGWVWVGGSRWSWPTHHYGRWGFTTGRWFWIPDRRWGPAWVSWAHAPGFVSWCPLGFDNRPVISITNVTIFDSRVRRAWTVLPSRTFVRNVQVRQYALPVQTIIPTETRFAALRTPSAPAVRTAAARRPLGAPTAIQSGLGSRAVAADRSVATQPSGASRTAVRSAPGAVRSPVESTRAPARAVAPARADRPVTSAPVNDADRALASRSAAPRRAPAAGALSGPSSPSSRDDRAIAVTPDRAVRTAEPARGIERAAPDTVDRAAPRRAAPARSRTPQPETPPERFERAAPANDSRGDAPPSDWGRPAQRRAPSASRSAPPESTSEPRSEAPAAASRARSRSSDGPVYSAPPRVERNEAPAPASRGRSRSDSAPATSAPPSAPAERPSRPAAPSDEGASRSRSADRPAPASPPSQSSEGRRRAGSRQ